MAEGNSSSAKTTGEASKDLVTFKVPSGPPSRKRVKVLDEDEYGEQLSNIIERDFFPELDKLKAQSEYINATDNADSATIQRLQARYSSKVSHRLNTPSTFETPQSDSKEDDVIEEPVVGVDPTLPEKPKESLDKFLAKHTSEDNESFNELMEETRKDFVENHSWMFKKEEQLSIENKATQLALPSPEQQAKNESQTRMTKGTPEGWTYKNANAVFYNPSGVELSQTEKIELAKKERQIVHENTRFKANPWKSKDQTENTFKTMKKEASLAKVGVDGKDLVDSSATPSINGYKLMRIEGATPQIHPEESPMMTWGEVESTPYRLEGCDTPLLASADGVPGYKMQAVPKRDRLALELAEKNSKFHRDKKGKAIHKVRSNIRTPNRGSLTDRISVMSPAAQRLASSKLGIRVGTDKVLYSPAASQRTPVRNKTPRLSTKESIALSVRKGTPTLNRDSMTDDLLQLPATTSSKRSKATDFI